MCLYTPSSCSSVSSSGSSSALSSLLDKGGHFSLLSSPSRKQSIHCQPHDRSNAPIILTEALEDRDVHALFKRRTAAPAPFLMTLLRDLAVDFVVFATFLTGNVVLEVTESA